MGGSLSSEATLLMMVTLHLSGQGGQSSRMSYVDGWIMDLRLVSSMSMDGWVGGWMDRIVMGEWMNG